MPHLDDAALVVGGQHAVRRQVQAQAGRRQRVPQQRHHLRWMALLQQRTVVDRPDECWWALLQQLDKPAFDIA